MCQENTSVSLDSSSSDQDPEMQSPHFQPSTCQAQFFASYVDALCRGSQDGLESEWWLVSQVLKAEAEVWEYSRLWNCNVTWVKEMKESQSLEWWFWDGSVCFLVLTHGGSLLGYNMVKI